MNLKFHHTSILLLCLLVAGCAQVVAPTGGPKDIEPPKVLKTVPKNQQTLFESKRIYLYFDEYVQLNNPGQQIVISPEMEIRPEFSVQGKSVIIEIKDTLRKNTTYNINFGNAIVDVHEQNALAGYTYSFATGEYIDSFVVSGVAVQAFNLEPCKGCVAALYDAETYTDSTLITKKPLYFSKTNDAGFYQINNLPAGSFRHVVFNDANKNLKWDKNELIGFRSDFINPADSATKNNLYLFYQDVYPINKLLDTLSTANGRFYFVFYKPYGVSISNEEGLEQFVYFKKGDKNFDTIQVFIADTALSPVFTINHADTTYQVQMRKSKVPRLPGFELNIPQQIEIGDSIYLQLKNPWLRFDTTFIKLYEDTISLLYTYRLDSATKTLRIYRKWEEGKRYKLDIKDSAVFDIYHQTNSQKKLEWTAKTAKDYANLIINIKNGDANKQYIMQLMDEQEKSILKQYTFKGNPVFEWNNVVPVKLKVKFISDRNENGIWDDGDVVKQIQPEKVMYYKELISLRAFWDMELTIDMDNLRE